MNRSLSLTLWNRMDFTLQHVIFLRASDHVVPIFVSWKHLEGHTADKSCTKTICLVQSRSDKFKSFPLEYLPPVYKIPKGPH